MTFWILVVGIPAALAALVIAWVFSRKVGAGVLTMLLAGAIGAVVADDLPNRPSPVERAVARANPGLPRMHCRSLDRTYRDGPLYVCTWSSGWLRDEHAMCVTLLADGSAQELDAFRC